MPPRRSKKIVESPSPSIPDDDEVEEDAGSDAEGESYESEEEGVGRGQSGLSSVIASEDMDIDAEGEDEEPNSADVSGSGSGSGSAEGSTSTSRERQPSPIKITLRVNQTKEVDTGGKRPSRAAAKKGAKRTKRATMEIEAASDDGLEDEVDMIETPEVDEMDDTMEDENESFQSVSPSKLTARQRAKHDKGLRETLLELPNDPGKNKLILTEAEKQLRREETARRRKRQSEQKRQDEQDQTINRLLRAQTSKSRNKLEDPLDGSPAPGTNSASVARRLMPASNDMIRFTSKLIDGKLVQTVSAPKGKETWIDLLPPSFTNHDRAEDVSATPKRNILDAQCGVKGCKAKRKYRSVKAFEVGACCMEHLKMVNAGLENAT
ncbi:hypothetical protein M231_05241 [Tremella mesenterica]|uniref:INO80 complex subunit B-like conserved region domain-containing protein n=1 Tax=Tremella mesenterica TaxID=5217 RepID=A0A4Q1BIQ8_TREME|nr:hypothetical protein M231_05241 [Tremella mesenterica]